MKSAIILVIATNLALATPITKTKKESARFDKCSSDFLWRALLAVGHGNVSAQHFLNSALEELGFTMSGIQAKSVAAAWQKQLKNVPTQSVFSQLQAFRAVHSQPKSPGNSTLTSSTELSTMTESTEVSTTKTPTTSTTTKRVPQEQKLSKNQKKGIRKAVKNISKLYEDDDHLSTSERKKKRKKLRRLLKEFLIEQKLRLLSDTGTIIAETRKTRSTSSKSRNKHKNKRHGRTDAVKICLLMIDELVTREVCEEVEESFKMALNQVQHAYSYDTDGSLSKVVVTASK